jgi:hypothetical protein
VHRRGDRLSWLRQLTRDVRALIERLRRPEDLRSAYAANSPNPIKSRMASERDGGPGSPRPCSSQPGHMTAPTSAMKRRVAAAAEKFGSLNAGSEPSSSLEPGKRQHGAQHDHGQSEGIAPTLCQFGHEVGGIPTTDTTMSTLNRSYRVADRALLWFAFQSRPAAPRAGLVGGSDRSNHRLRNRRDPRVRLVP